MVLFTVYHPKTNSETEWVNQELETYMCIFTQGKPAIWASLLPMAEFSHNSTTHSTTQHSLFYIMMGYEPRSYLMIEKTFLPNLEKWMSTLSATREEAVVSH